VKKTMTLLACVMAAFSMSVHAADAASAASAPTKQQSKMTTCSADFKKTGKAGSEREAYMSECLKKKEDPKAAQQEKMKSCSADFKKTGKAGSERQAYMSECLSK
jgi:outer membrane lipoprotein-sorting protein